jgi:hypothetical protein
MVSAGQQTSTITGMGDNMTCHYMRCVCYATTYHVACYMALCALYTPKQPSWLLIGRVDLASAGDVI